MRTSTPAKASAAAALLARREVWSRRSPQYGPNDSVMPNRFARAPARPRRSAGRTASRLPGRSESRSASANRGSCGERRRLVGPAAEQRDPLPFEERQRALRFGHRLGEQRGPGDERRQQAGRRTRPSRRTASGCRGGRRAEAPRLEPGRGGTAARRRGCGSTPFGAPRLPDVKMTTRSSAGRTAASSASTELRGRRRRRSATRRSASHTVIERSRGNASTTSPRPGDEVRGDRREVGEVVATAERRDDDEVLDARGAELGRELRRPQQRAQRHERPPPARAAPSATTAHSMPLGMQHARRGCPCRRPPPRTGDASAAVSRVELAVRERRRRR